MSSLLTKIPSKTGTFYGKDRLVESYKQGDILYHKNLNRKTSCGKIVGFRKELTDYDRFISSFMVESLTGEMNEVFLDDVVFSFSKESDKSE
jgi:hypothetical protein